ncbi:MAG: endonuclease/exonuclease/phosphatase family protein [Chloroflexota bacterium]
MSRELRLITINTGKCDGPYFPRREALACQLQLLRADVIALQESFASVDGGIATADYLAKALQMHVSFAPARRKRRWLEGRELLSDSGMAFLSRRPFERVTTVKLPVDPNDGDRVAQVAVLVQGSRRLALINAHLCHLPESGSMRAQQLETVLRHASLQGDYSARLLLGDLNATLESSELRPLLHGEMGWHVLDAYGAGNGPLPRDTVARHNSWHGPRQADRCIDFMLSLAPSASQHPVFRSSSIVLNQPHAPSGVFPSDHYGVATTLLI